MSTGIPAEAGMIVRTAPAGTPPTVIPAKAGMIVRTALAGTPPTVIPAKAGTRWIDSGHVRLDAE